MKRICIYVTLGLLGAVSAHAQEINIGQAVARKISDDKVEVSFNMDCSILRLPSRRQMIITPLIISRSESDTLALPSVCIAGRNRYRMNKRKESLYGKEPAAGEGQEMIRFNRKRDMLLEYNETVPAQEWMSEARVEIFRELQGCAGCGEALGNAPVAELPLFKEVVERPNLEIMVAQAEEKRRSFTRSAYLNFKVNQSALLADYMNNPAELAKIHSSIDSIREDDNYRIARIKIVGDHLLSANSFGNAHHLRPYTVGVLAPAQMGRCVGEVAHEVSDGAFLRGDALLRGLLRAAAVRHRAVHTGGEPDGNHGERADDGGLPAKQLLLRRLPDGGKHRGPEMPEPRSRPCGMDDTGGRYGVLDPKLR